MVKTASLHSLPSQYRSKDLYGPWNMGNNTTAAQARERREMYLAKRKEQYRKKIFQKLCLIRSSED